MSRYSLCDLPKLLAVPLILLLLFGGVKVVLADAPPNIDTFANPFTSAVIVYGGDAAVTVTTAGTGDNILGNSRDVHVYDVQGPTAQFVTVNVTGGEFSQSQNSQITARVVLTYDGATSTGYPSTAAAGLCSTPGPPGSGCVDLTKVGGTSGIANGFLIDVVADDLAMDVRIKVYDGPSSTGYEKLFTNLIPGGPLGFSGPVFVPFPAISAAYDFKTVGAIEVEFIGKTGATDLTIGSITTALADWGDLPEIENCLSPINIQNGYATKENCQGPRHLYSGTLFLGTQFDPTPAQPGEGDGQPSPSAYADDSNNLDDEDGVARIAGVGCASPTLWCDGPSGGGFQVNVTGSGGYLLAWIDFNGNGFEPNTIETVINSPVNPGLNTFYFNIPSGTMPGDPPAPTSRTLFARFRLFPASEIAKITDTDNQGNSSYPLYQFDGRKHGNEFLQDRLMLTTSSSGEVEDYVWFFTPTAVTLADFFATQQGDYLRVTWETASELDNRGFNLHRGTSPDEPDLQLNTTLIPSQSQGNPGGFTYTWDDHADLAPGTTYYYWLDDVDVNNVVTRHGPVSVDFIVPTAVTLGGLQAGPAAGMALPWLWVLAAAGAALGVSRLRRRA